MKKLVLLLLIAVAMMVNLSLLNATGLKKLKLIDKSVQVVNHVRVYYFQTADGKPIDTKQLSINLKTLKQVHQISFAGSDEGKATRIVVTVDLNYVLSQSKDFQQAFTKSGFEIENMPTNEK